MYHSLHNRIMRQPVVGTTLLICAFLELSTWDYVNKPSCCKSPCFTHFWYIIDDIWVILRHLPEIIFISSNRFQNFQVIDGALDWHFEHFALRQLNSSSKSMTFCFTFLWKVIKVARWVKVRKSKISLIVVFGLILPPLFTDTEWRSYFRVEGSYKITCSEANKAK